CGILQGDLSGRGTESTDPEQQGEQGCGQCDRELSGDGTPLTAEPATEPASASATGGTPHHDTVSARRTRSVRMPRTSSDRMITTSRPAKATAAIVVIAYSAVAAPVSSVNSCAARLLVSGGRSFSFMCFFFLSRDASRPRLRSEE